ncbi:MAG: hypothetical protein O6851_03745 [Gemmatimonadetes bacterium]|nr:hypothetical protein [Gemmatimonadota bacterium]
MSRCKPHLPLAAFLTIVLLPATVLAQEAEYGSPEAKAMIEDALSAITAELAMGATVVDWEQNVLKEGDNGWTCFPTPANFEKAPMCFDEPWLAWADGWMNQEPVSIDRVGIGYMLAGDSGASNSDPYAEEPTDDWVVTGPHLMVIVPNNAGLEGITTEPGGDGPWVMWAGTPYAHIMVPVGKHGHMREGMHKKEMGCQ